MGFKLIADPIKNKPVNISTKTVAAAKKPSTTETKPLVQNPDGSPHSTFIPARPFGSIPPAVTGHKILPPPKPPLVLPKELQASIKPDSSKVRTNSDGKVVLVLPKITSAVSPFTQGRNVEKSNTTTDSASTVLEVLSHTPVGKKFPIIGDTAGLIDLREALRIGDDFKAVMSSISLGAGKVPGLGTLVAFGADGASNLKEFFLPYDPKQNPAVPGSVIVPKQPLPINRNPTAPMAQSTTDVDKIKPLPNTSIVSNQAGSKGSTKALYSPAKQPPLETSGVNQPTRYLRNVKINS